MTEENPAPDIRVVKGEPTDEELAALVAAINVVSARARRPPSRPSNWSAYWRSVRAPVHPGPDGWLASTRPGR